MVYLFDIILADSQHCLEFDVKTHKTISGQRESVKHSPGNHILARYPGTDDDEHVLRLCKVVSLSYAKFKHVYIVLDHDK